MNSKHQPPPVKGTGPPNSPPPSPPGVAASTFRSAACVFHSFHFQASESVKIHCSCRFPPHRWPLPRPVTVGHAGAVSPARPVPSPAAGVRPWHSFLGSAPLDPDRGPLREPSTDGIPALPRARAHKLLLVAKPSGPLSARKPPRLSQQRLTLSILPGPRAGWCPALLPSRARSSTSVRVLLCTSV